MSDARPINCRFRLADEGKAYPKSGCEACGATIATGLGKRCHWQHEDGPPKPETIRERIEGVRADATAYLTMWRLGEEWKAGNLIPRDEHLSVVERHVKAAVSEAVREERERLADWAEAVSRENGKEAKRLGLILNGRHRFAARKFLQFANAMRESKSAAIRKEPDHD